MGADVAVRTSGRSLGARLASRWFVRSLLVGAFASACDWGTVLCCARALGWPSAFCAACGLTIGSTLSFTLNRKVAFTDCRLTLWTSALRYAGAIGCLMVVHASAVGILTDRSRLPILVSKLIADVTILSFGQLLLLRYIVFPRNKAAASPAVAPRPPAELA
ncbi:MAG: GtrA family protein [Myxococcaceae bacterium]|nr:GtrA family protein [Myxococcaceae bacterium]